MNNGDIVQFFLMPKKKLKLLSPSSFIRKSLIMVAKKMVEHVSIGLKRLPV